MKIAGSDSSIVAIEPAVMTAQPSKVALSGSSDAATSAIKHVSISGMALLLSRQFGSEDIDANPRIETRLDDVGLAMNPVYFLTKDDRALLAEMYEYAQDQGADLKHVDKIVFDLARYRQLGDGQIMINRNNGTMFDIEGRAQTFSFTEKDAAAAERILNSDSLHNTKLDRGFLEYILNPGFTNHGSDFDFMEQMVYKFSNTGSAPESLDPKFSTYAINENNYIIHTANEITLKVPSSNEAFTSVSGTGATLNTVDSLISQPKNAALKFFLESSLDQERPKGLVSALFELWQKYGITTQK